MNRSIRRAMTTLFALTLLGSGTGAALAGAPRTHDGFFLRLSTGLGNASTKIDVTGASLEFSGLSGGADLAIGGMVQPNLALHGTIFGWTMSDPDAELTSFPKETVSGTVMMSGFGGGVTYYMMPANVYFTGSVGMGSVRFDLPDLGADETSETGIAYTVGLGKEWWVGQSWGLGLSGNFIYHSVPDKTIDEKWAGPSFDLRFSATFN